MSWKINKEGKYLCTEEKKQIRVGKLVNWCKIFNIEKIKNDPIDYWVVFSLNPSFPLYFFNCKDVDEDLLKQIVPLIHHDAKLLFFNINHITSNDIDILDQIFSEYLMSNYKTT